MEEAPEERVPDGGPPGWSLVSELAPAPGIQRIDHCRLAATTYGFIAHQLRRVGQLQHCKAVAILRTWDLHSHRRRVDISCGAGAAIYRVLAVPVPEGVAVAAQEAVEEDPARVGRPLAEVLDPNRIPPYVAMIRDAGEQSASCGYVYANGVFRMWVNRNFADRFFDAAEAQRRFDGLAVLPEFIFGCLLSPRDRPCFFELLMEYMLTDCDDVRHMSMVGQVIDRDRNVSICLLRVRYQVLNKGQYAALAINILPLPNATMDMCTVYHFRKPGMRRLVFQGPGAAAAAGSGSAQRSGDGSGSGSGGGGGSDGGANKAAKEGKTSSPGGSTTSSRSSGGSAARTGMSRSTARRAAPAADGKQRQQQQQAPGRGTRTAAAAGSGGGGSGASDGDRDEEAESGIKEEEAIEVEDGEEGVTSGASGTGPQQADGAAGPSASSPHGHQQQEEKNGGEAEGDVFMLPPWHPEPAAMVAALGGSNSSSNSSAGGGGTGGSAGGGGGSDAAEAAAQLGASQAALSSPGPRGDEQLSTIPHSDGEGGAAPAAASAAAGGASVATNRAAVPGDGDDDADGNRGDGSGTPPPPVAGRRRDRGRESRNISMPSFGMGESI